MPMRARAPCRWGSAPCELKRKERCRVARGSRRRCAGSRRRSPGRWPDWSGCSARSASGPRRSPSPSCGTKTSWMRVLLPLPATPVTPTSMPLRDVHVQALEVVEARAADLPGRPSNAVAWPRRRPRRARPRRISLAVSESPARNASRGPSKMTCAAPPARARADLHHVVRGGDHRRIVLHDQDRVALVPQPPQHLDRAGRCRGRAGRSTARPGRTSARSGRSRAGGPS